MGSSRRRRERRHRNRQARADSELIAEAQDAEVTEPQAVGQILDNATESFVRGLEIQFPDEETGDNLDAANRVADEIAREVHGGSQHSDTLQLLYTTLCSCIDRLNPEESMIFFEAHPELARFD